MKCSTCSYERQAGFISSILGREFSHCEHCKKSVCNECHQKYSSLCSGCFDLVGKIQVTKKPNSKPGEHIVTRECGSLEEAVFELQKMCLVKGGKFVSEMWIDISRNTTSYSTHTPPRITDWGIVKTVRDGESHTTHNHSKTYKGTGVIIR